MNQYAYDFRVAARDGPLSSTQQDSPLVASSFTGSLLQIHLGRLQLHWFVTPDLPWPLAAYLATLEGAFVATPSTVSPA